MKVFTLTLVALGLFFSSSNAYSDWHTGQVDFLGYGYDGQTITLHIKGWSRDNCTCYPTWPGYACLDRSRLTYKEEMATILAAKTVEKPIYINIDESTCKIISLYVD